MNFLLNFVPIPMPIYYIGGGGGGGDTQLSHVVFALMIVVAITLFLSIFCLALGVTFGAFDKEVAEDLLFKAAFISITIASFVLGLVVCVLAFSWFNSAG